MGFLFMQGLTIGVKGLNPPPPRPTNLIHEALNLQHLTLNLKLPYKPWPQTPARASCPEARNELAESKAFAEKAEEAWDRLWDLGKLGFRSSGLGFRVREFVIRVPCVSDTSLCVTLNPKPPGPNLNPPTTPLLLWVGGRCRAAARPWQALLGCRGCRPQAWMVAKR